MSTSDEWPAGVDPSATRTVSEGVITDPAVLRRLLGDDLFDLAMQSPGKLQRSKDPYAPAWCPDLGRLHLDEQQDPYAPVWCPCGHWTGGDYQCLNGRIYGPCGDDNCTGVCDDTHGTCHHDNCACDDGDGDD